MFPSSGSATGRSSAVRKVVRDRLTCEINRPPMDRADRLALEPSPNLRNNPLNPVPHPGTYEIDPKIPPFPEAQDHRNTTFPAQEKTVKRAPVKRLLLS